MVLEDAVLLCRINKKLGKNQHAHTVPRSEDLLSYRNRNRARHETIKIFGQRKGNENR